MALPKRKTKREPKNYIDNKKFYDEMVKYIDKCNEAKNQSKERPKANNYIGQCIMDIAINMAKNFNFSRYPFKDEMINDAIENCILYIHNFNPEKYKNPFSYFSQITYFAFLRRISAEKKILYKKYKQIEQFNLESQLLGDMEEQIVYSDGALDNMTRFIQEYEDKLEKIKKE